MSHPKEVWIVKGIVTDPESYPDDEVNPGVTTEWQFSDGPVGQRGGSSDYLSLEQGLADHSGCVIHWCGDE